MYHKGDLAGHCPICNIIPLVLLHANEKLEHPQMKFTHNWTNITGTI